MSKPVVLRSHGIYVLNWLGVAGLIVGFAAVAVSGPGPNPGLVDYVGVAVFGAVVALLFLRATRMRVELADSGVTVYRLLTTQQVAWEDISDVRVDYFGLHIVCRSGVVVSAGSMGKSNWSTWRGTRTSADSRVDQLRAAVETHIGGPLLGSSVDRKQ